MNFTQKSKSVIFTGFVLLSVLIAFSACKPDISVVNTFYVTYDANAGENTVTGSVEKQSAKEGESVTVAENAFEIEDKVFIEWNTKADGSGDSYKPGDSITLNSDITLFAQWQDKKTYTVKFFPNVADNEQCSGEMPEQAYMEEEYKTLAPNTFTRIGFVFTGWNTKPDGTGTAYTDAQSILCTQDLDLYAQWEKEVPVYTLKFNLKDGTGSINDQRIKENQKASQPESKPEKLGSSFEGWFTSDDDGLTLSDAPFDFDTPITGDIILYAKWKLETYTVTFNPNAGSDTVTGSMPSQIFTYGLEQNLFTNTFERSGYLFGGWNTLAAPTDGNPGTKYSDGQRLSVTQNLVLYAQWQLPPPNSYTVSFDSNGGSSVAYQFITEDNFAQKPAPDPVKNGYIFEGWYTGTKASDGTITYASPFSFTDTAITADIILYAKWRPENCIVTFDSNGGSSVVNPQQVEFDTKAQLPADEPKRTGYEFDGWFRGTKAADGKVTLSDTKFDFENTSITASITLYAKWTPITYTVYFMDGTSIKDYRDADYDSFITRPDNPTKTGATFDDWYADSSFVTKFDFTKPITGDTNIYMRWKYTVTFETNGGSAVESVIVKDGEQLAKPADPAKTGLVVYGWYKDSGLTEKLDFPATITTDTTLYACWASEITFDSKGGTDVEKLLVPEGEKPICPAEPTKNGYAFIDWYTSSDGGNTLSDKFDFDAVITASVTLYARWKIIVAFNSMGGSAVERQLLELNEKAVKPAEDPERDCFLFDGWHVSSDNGTTLAEDNFDFDTEITAPVTLYARWIQYTFCISDNGDDTSGSGVTDKPYKTMEKALTAICAVDKKLDFIIKVNGLVTGQNIISNELLPDTKALSLLICGASSNAVDKLDGNKCNSVVEITTNVPVTFKNITITAGEVSVEGYGGGVTLRNSEEIVTFGSGTLITGNKGASSSYKTGGGVYVVQGTLILEDGSKISNNTSFSGGGISIADSSAHVIMNGGEISDNTATDNASTYYGGGGIYSRGGVGAVKMNGGIITRNKAAFYGSAVAIVSGEFCISGNAYIPVEEDGSNTVFLNPSYDGKILVSNNLTAETPVATIKPDKYTIGQQVIYGATDSEGNTIPLTETICNKLAILQQTNIDRWYIDTDGKLALPVYNISYKDKNGAALSGVNPEETKFTHTYGYDTVLLEPVRENYIFQGWHLRPDCSDPVITKLGAKDYTDNITLYARWSKAVVLFTINNESIKLTKTESDSGVITITADNGYTDYRWKIDELSPASAITGATVSADGKTLTFSKNNMIKGMSYLISLTAKNSNGIVLRSAVTAKKQEAE
jgi:uncharacterized repeat protein (TIGR02543 family)